jgi:hypothetical protein
MRLAAPASLHEAPARAGAARIRCAPVHQIHRQARIHRGIRSDPPECCLLYQHMADKWPTVLTAERASVRQP